MITGRWGKPSDVLLDLVVDEDGTVRGVANPGRQNAPIQRGHFDATSGVVDLEGEHVRPDDRMGGERLLGDRGQFGGAFGWRDVSALIG